ncbi:dehydrogenase [Pyxidicoccus parkwayensis]|uniref:Dehydrogenase n=1 Tax=Pyxidicoccus parkwayensis TaxID=2813578 RepID=A0ABX7P4Z9_9BACT|nr:YciI family protein [Pyxidicoccus parkwaysis]QSQ25517.1 dehydrogenase [Pyxidicoccus parkwaysis]
MAFMLMILEPRGQRLERTQEQAHHAMDRMLRFREDLKSRGILRLGESLRSDDNAVRVGLRGGKRVVNDGPFAEAKEMVGGIFLLDCKSMDEALAIAGECPAAEWATVEVRELGPCFADTEGWPSASVTRS